MITREQLNTFLTTYDSMRVHQKAYFKGHGLDDLRKAERAEKQIDKLRKEIKIEQIPDEQRATWKKFTDYFDLMRRYQILYFRNKMRADKTKAMQYETLTDGVRLELKINEAEPAEFVQGMLPL